MIFSALSAEWRCVFRLVSNHQTDTASARWTISFKTSSAIKSHDEHALLPPFHTQPDRRNLVRLHSGDFTHQETHVPIPNTTVKLMGPTIVPKGVKIGHCRELLNTSRRAISARCFSFPPPKKIHRTQATAPPHFIPRRDVYGGVEGVHGGFLIRVANF